MKCRIEMLAERSQHEFARQRTHLQTFMCLPAVCDHMLHIFDFCRAFPVFLLQRDPRVLAFSHDGLEISNKRALRAV